MAFGADTKHIQSKPFTVVDSTNIIERFHGTLKERTKVIKSFKNMDTAKLLTDAWLVHYNFFKEHEYLDNVSPAQKMGIKVPFKDWAEVLEQTKQDMIMPADAEERQIIHHLPIVHTYTRTRTRPVKPSKSTSKVPAISTSSRIR